VPAKGTRCSGMRRRVRRMALSRNSSALSCSPCLRSSATMLAIWIGVGFIFQGVAEAVVAISHPLLPARGWHILLGILTVIAGIVVMVWPFGSVVVLAIVAGAWLVVIGITQIIWAFQARKAARTVEHGIERLTSPA
jgi:uncharacterized membrane protein HdeD (DUF308 family)